jgi:rubrerythrin
MIKTIKGSKTEINLMIAFASESMAVNRYLYFAKAATEEGLKVIADIFSKISTEEKSHASVFYKFFEGGAVEVTASFPAVKVADTKSNLEASIKGENATWTTRYPDFEQTAREEGFFKIAGIFQRFANSEKNHEDIFKKVFKELRR